MFQLLSDYYYTVASSILLLTNSNVVALSYTIQGLALIKLAVFRAVLCVFTLRCNGETKCPWTYNLTKKTLIELCFLALHG